MIGLSNPIYTTQDNFYTNLLKYRISELEKQLTDKNAIFDFLSVQMISKPPDTQENINKEVIMVKLTTNPIKIERL